MVCPFRVIVILLSCIVAITAAFIALRQPVEVDEDGEDVKPCGPTKSWKQLFLDFWTGRYLWSHIKPFIKSSSSSDMDGEVEADVDANADVDVDREREVQVEGDQQAEGVPASGEHEE